MTSLSKTRFLEALTHQRTGRLMEALSVYQDLLKGAPDRLDVLNNMGACLTDLGRVEEAVDVLSRAIELSPDDADLLNNMGNALQRADRIEEAIIRFKVAVQSSPGNAVIRLNLAKAFLRQGEYAAGVEQLERARLLEPESVAIKFTDVMALPVIYDSEEQLDAARVGFSEKLSTLEDGTWTLTDPPSEVGMSNFYLPYQGQNDRELQERLAKAYLKACPLLEFIAPHCHDTSRRREGRIRLGFISAHFGSHTIGKLFEGLVTGIDRETFEITVFLLKPVDNELETSFQRLLDSIDHIVMVPPGLKQAQTLIASCEIDILYYPDIGMEPVSYFLAFARLAAVQCATWGHPVTTGIPNIDYFISFRNQEPTEPSDHYSEQLKVLDGFCTRYTPPVFAEPPNRMAMGLPEGVTLYVCPQSLFKVHPGDDKIWGEILRNDPNGWIIFLGGQETKWGEQLKKRFSKSLPDVSDRIDILRRLSGREFLQVLQLADVVLDTPRWSGGRTSLEAFAAGKVVVTLAGDFMRGLFTAGLYRHMGLGDLISESSEAYIEMAVSLGTNGQKRNYQESRIKTRSNLIFNNDETIETHSKFFQEAFCLVRSELAHKDN